jgi:hypothetical protein
MAVEVLPRDTITSFELQPRENADAGTILC